MAKINTRLFSLMFLLLAMSLVAAQAKTDFTGTWKVSTSKSDFGPMPPPDSMTQKVTHQEPDLKTNVASTGGPMGDMTYDVNYTTDGKESVNSMNGAEFKSVAKWDGDDLLIDTKGKFGDNEFTSKDRWKLSSDGKTLTIERHISSAMGDADMKMIYDKQ